MPSEHISFGFLYTPIQLTDVAAPLDVLANVTHPMATKYAPLMPHMNSAIHQRMRNASLDITFHHIGPTMSPVETSGRLCIQPTCSIDDCPPLDYLLVGGPSPEYSLPGGEMPEGMKRFLRERCETATEVFATCSGAMVLAAAGVLDGKKASVNHALVPACQKAFKEVQWDSKLNWVVDGKFWTAGGAMAGMDMVAEWTRRKVGDELMGLCTMLLEYQPRDVNGRPLSYINGRGEYVDVEAGAGTS